MYHRFNKNGGNDRTIHSVLKYYDLFLGEKDSLIKRIFEKGYYGCQILIEEKRKLKNRLQKNPAVYIYGAGDIGRAAGRYLVAENLASVKGFVVSKPENNPSSIDGLPVIRIEDASPCAFYMIAVKEQYEEEISATLKQAGIENVIVMSKILKWHIWKTRA